MLTNDQIKHMVNRFLGWKLPEDFTPDAGISFDVEKCRYGMTVHFPIGTNLFTATQAEAMIRYLTEGMPQNYGGACLWCGKVYQHESLDALAEAVHEHYGTCEEAPHNQLAAENHRLKKELEEAHEATGIFGVDKPMSLLDSIRALKAELEEARTHLKLSAPLFSRRELEAKLATSEALASERGAQVLLLREALESTIYHREDDGGRDETWCTSCGYIREATNHKGERRVYSHADGCKLDSALASTADAAEKVRREILEGAWERLTVAMGKDGREHEDYPDYRAAILAEDAP